MTQPRRNRVLLMIIDALTTRVVQPALQAGRLPNFARLIAAGGMVPHCVSIFPSITPAATATLITGAYPSEHHIAGAYWYEVEKQRIAYYGADIWVILREGIGKFFRDFQQTLNEKHLKSPTLFETAQRAGLSTACVNYLWFHGLTEHPTRAPLLLQLIPGAGLHDTVHGPDVLYLGDFVRPEWSQVSGGITRRYGFHDDVTFECLLEMAARGPLPDFTCAYFPNNDFESHNLGPRDAEPTLEKVDARLGELLEACGGLERFLAESALVLTGDHSQSELLPDASERALRIDELLADFPLVPAGDVFTADDQIMLCTNLRACQVYTAPRFEADLSDLVARCLSSPKIDQVIWQGDGQRDGNGPENVDRATHVATADRGRLTFRRGRHFPDSAQDVYGTTWSWQGDLAAVDGRVEDGRLHFGEYPNAFERLANGFPDVGGDLWLTARIGHEFQLPATHLDGGGSHGSLHVLDSIVPLITAGLPEHVRIPEHPRTVDVADICAAALGLEHGSL
jgi:hypothetical protein